MQKMFEWFPADTQTYDGQYGTQDISSTGANLSKLPGACFYMDAPGETLTLVALVKEEDPETSTLRWGINSDEDITQNAEYICNHGELTITHHRLDKMDWGFLYIGLNSSVMDGDRYTTHGSAPVSFSIQNESRVEAIVGGFFTGPKTSFTVRDNAHFITENMATGVSGIIDVVSNGYARINSREFFALRANIRNASSGFINGYSLVIDDVAVEEHEMDWGTSLFDTHITCEASSATKIAGKGWMVIGGNTIFHVKENAKLFFDVTNIRFVHHLDESTFELSSGSPGITFANAENVIKLNETDFPEGIFCFKKGLEGDCNGTFTFLNANAFVQQKLIQSGYFKVDNTIINTENYKQYLKITQLGGGYNIAISLLHV